MERAVRLLLAGVVVVLLGCLAGAACAARAQAFAPYRIPPHEPTPKSAAVRNLLQGSSVSSTGSWIVVHLQGGPYQIGFQNGYLTAQSSDYAIMVDVGTRGSSARTTARTVARRYIWPRVPLEYRTELRGIANGMHAAGYPSDTLWDVVAANAWADEDCYATLLGKSATAATAATGAPAAAFAAAVPAAATSSAPLTLGAHRKGKGGCSAFIATGSATADGAPVMGHDTWSQYSGAFMYNVMFYVHPLKGYAFSYQSAGGEIWSGQDWYENSAGLLLTETTLADTVYTPSGTPVFVRAREAAQYDATVAQAVQTLVHGNNGAYSNEWLIGDATGTIASLQLGGKVYDLHETRNGFYGSSNFDWGTKTRAEERAHDAGWAPDSYDGALVDYARYRRWGQLKSAYHGKIDAAVGKTMESDTFDTYLARRRPDARDLCGEPEHATPGLRSWDSWVNLPEGATDGKVCTEAMARSLQSWACWGHGSGDHFSAARYLASPSWRARNGALGVFGLKTFAAQTTDRWLRLNDPVF
jgi:hypothetical protein